MFESLSKLIPHEGDTLLLTLARDGEGWRVNLVPHPTDATLAEARSPLTLVASLEDLETGFEAALERFCAATAPLLEQVEQAIQASKQAAEEARAKVAPKSAKPPAKSAPQPKPEVQAEPAAQGDLFSASAAASEAVPSPAPATEPALVTAPPVPFTPDPQAQLKRRLGQLGLERQSLSERLNGAAASFELEGAFVEGVLHPSLDGTPLGRKYLEVVGKIQMLERRGTEALSEVV